MTLVALAELGRGVIPTDTPVVYADDEAVLRGRAVFETLRVYGGTPFRLEAHLERLSASAASLRLPEPPHAAFAETAQLAVEAGGLADAGLRFLWTPGREGERTPHGFVLVATLPPGLDELRARGLRVVTTAWAPGALAGAKSTSYAENMVAQEVAVAGGADDALFVGSDRTVLEAPTANVWVRRGDTLYTPALSLGLLSGVTRSVLCELAPGLGYRVEEGRFGLDDLLGGEEVFLSSSVREVMPVVAVDGQAFAAGPAAAGLQAGLRSLAAGYPGDG